MERDQRVSNGPRNLVVIGTALASATLLLGGPTTKTVKTLTARSHPTVFADVKLESSRKAATSPKNPALKSPIRIVLRGGKSPRATASTPTVVPSGAVSITLKSNDTSRKKPHTSQEVIDTRPLRGWKLLHDGVFDPETEALYTALEADRVYSLTQNAFDPDSFETGVIDIPRAITGIAARYPDGIRGYVQLDWEDPFFSILHRGPSHPRYDEVRDNYADFIRRFKTAFPEADVTHYNIPFIPFWVENTDGQIVYWSNIDEERLARYHADLDALRPILDEMDWFCPRYFDFVPSAEIPAEERAARVQAEIDHRAAIVRWLKEYIATSDRPDREIIPVGRTHWSGGAASYEQYDDLPIPKDEFIDEQLVPAMENGAAGLMLFEGPEMWMLNIAFSPPEKVSDDLRAMALAVFRRLGLLEEDELPNWSSAAQKREFLRVLGANQAPYIAAIASRMRAEVQAPDSDEEPGDPEQPDGTKP